MIWMVLLVLGLASVNAQSKATCLRDAESGKCEFYDCYEAEAHCGSEGYLEGYGGKYCRRFNVTGHYFNQFYDCYEAEAHCGSEGYLEGYGGKYCRRFNVTGHYFNQEGRNWVNCVRVCLTTGMESWYTADVLSCDQILHDAFQLHPKCYVDCGFCKVVRSFTNLAALVRTFDVGDFFSKVAVQQVYDVVKACLSG